uniref:Uncharacterized protein n=1 Tax=viral metagenome TaxID=1070528 RepID=A0A6M3JAK5_9ZZZZ
MNLPKTYNFGDNELIEISHLETTFGISRKMALRYLRALRIKPLYFGDGIFFSLPTFNRILFVLSRPGSPGFLFPGTDDKTKKRLRDKGFLIEVTNEILNEANSPRVLAEMAAATGRDSSMIKKLISQSNAQARKEPKK